MAKPRPSDLATKTLHRKLNTPGPFLRGMLVFLALVGFLVAIIHQQLSTAFWNNPLLNGLIVGVLAIGILRAFGQVVRLYPEIRWVNAYRIADPGQAGGPRRGPSSWARSGVVIGSSSTILPPVRR